MVGALLEEARALKPRQAWHDILRGFERNDLLTYASAIAFQVFFALIPLALLALGLLGAFGLTDVWTKDLAPHVKANLSHDAYAVIDHTARKILAHQRLFWATAGALIAIWEVSGAMRATMQVLNRIYDTNDDRNFWRRVGVSIWLSALVTVLLLAAVAATKGVPALLDDGPLAGLAGWIVAAGLMTATVGAIVRFAPSKERPLRWVSFGTLLVIAGWVGASLVFAWYVTDVADYGSVFGNLAVVMVTLGYIYLQAIVFLTGLQLDSLIRHQVEPVAGAEEAAPAPEIIVARSLESAKHELGGGANGAGVTGHEQGGDERVAPGL